MKSKKLIFILLLLMLGGYIGIFANNYYQDYKYLEILKSEKNYVVDNKKEYLKYHHQYNDATNEEVLKIINNNFQHLPYDEKLKSIINDSECIDTNIESYYTYNSNFDSHQNILIINNYLDKLNKYDLNYLLKFVQEKYYINKNLKRYLDYAEINPQLSIREVIETVNCNCDKPYYTDTQPTDLSYGNLILCNKYYYLPADYIPDNLIIMDKKYSSVGAKLVKEAYDAFVEMHNAALNDGYYIVANDDNAYRSYQQQQKTYDYYKNAYGVEGADTCSARPGYSEHQTGLTVDTAASKTDGTEFPTYEEEYRWLRENSWKYGFIFRYQENKEFYTGYQCEQWHYRFVGKDVSKYIHDNGITFDEYYQFFVADNSITEEEFLKMFN
ncbi:MAG: M15 family metallopeptidase [Erysipelotrichia bacterium]|nr:M15 family metallopeptidase [Erysipelotrichia bacterium]